MKVYVTENNLDKIFETIKEQLKKQKKLYIEIKNEEDDLAIDVEKNIFDYIKKYSWEENELKNIWKVWFTSNLFE